MCCVVLCLRGCRYDSFLRSVGRCFVGVCPTGFLATFSFGFLATFSSYFCCPWGQRRTLFIPSIRLSWLVLGSRLKVSLAMAVTSILASFSSSGFGLQIMLLSTSQCLLVAHDFALFTVLSEVRLTAIKLVTRPLKQEFAHSPVRCLGSNS